MIIYALLVVRSFCYGFFRQRKVFQSPSTKPFVIRSFGRSPLFVIGFIVICYFLLFVVISNHSYSRSLFFYFVIHPFCHLLFLLFAVSAINF